MKKFLSLLTLLVAIGGFSLGCDKKPADPPAADPPLMLPLMLPLMVAVVPLMTAAASSRWTRESPAWLPVVAVPAGW